jgi:hypothetical protein
MFYALWRCAMRMRKLDGRKSDELAAHGWRV